MRLRSSAFTSGFRMRLSAVYASCTEALRKLTLPDDLVVWTMPSGFLKAPLVGETTRLTDVESRGPRGRGSPRRWKESTGKWVSLCRSRATRHAPRLPSSSLRWGLLSGPFSRPALQSQKAIARRREEKKGKRPDRAARTVTGSTGRRVLDIGDMWSSRLPSELRFHIPAFSSPSHSRANWLLFSLFLARHPRKNQ